MPKVVYLGAVHRNIVMRTITQINEMNANFTNRKTLAQMRANGCCSTVFFFILSSLLPRRWSQNEWKKEAKEHTERKKIEEKKNTYDILPFRNNIFPTRIFNGNDYFLPSVFRLPLLHMMMMMRFYLKIIIWNCFVLARTVKWTVPQLVESLCSIIRLVRLYNWENEQWDCLHFFFLRSPAIPCIAFAEYTQIHRFGLDSSLFLLAIFFFCPKFIACSNCSQIFFFFFFSSSLVNVETQFQGSANCWDCFSQQQTAIIFFFISHSFWNLNNLTQCKSHN